MHKHHQVVIEHGEWRAAVDEHIAELILEMWKADIYTLLSCENNNNGKDNGDVIWIMMPQYEAPAFLNCLLGGRERDDFYWRVVGEGLVDDWKFGILVDDLSERYDEGNDELYFKGTPDIDFSMSIRFPIWDYHEVLQRMKEYNARKTSKALSVAEPLKLQQSNPVVSAPVAPMAEV